MTNSVTKLSVVILAKNEGKRIEACLRSVSFADEIVVIDNGSEDETCKIAQQLGAKVINVESSDFSLLRNKAISETRGLWILYIDADEIVTDELREEILRLLDSGDTTYSAYFIKRKNNYLGHPWPITDKMQRLFFKKNLLKWYGPLHETAVINGRESVLHGYVNHDTHRTLEEMVIKTNNWSAKEALLRFNAMHPKMTWWRFLRVMVTAFSHTYFLQGGYKAGTVGLIESLYQAFSLFITYAKLWELQGY